MEHQIEEGNPLLKFRSSIITHRKHWYIHWYIQIHGKTIHRVEHARFLGVYIDEKLQWNERVNQISAKV